MAEIAGVVLGAVPVVLEALKQYESLCTLCRRLKQWKVGVNQLLHRLQVQQKIFQNETELLLKGALGRGVAQLMIQDLTHSQWQDPSTEIRIDRFLGNSKFALVTAGQAVADRMKSFAEDLDAVHVGRPQSTDQDWKKDIRKRFRYMFSAEKLMMISEAIANLTTEYRTLRSQVCEMAISEPEPDVDLRSRQTSLERIATTRAAAQRVYEVLVMACRLHTKHYAHFSLEPQVMDRGTATEIKFRIAFRHLAMSQAQGQQDSIWFEIESVLFGSVPMISRPFSVAGSMIKANKRSRSPELETIREVVPSEQKRVRFEIDSAVLASSSTARVSPTSDGATGATLPLLPDLVGNRDLCRQLRACCHNKQQNGDCIGLLEQSAIWQHRLFPSVAPASRSITTDAETLTTLLKSVQEDAGWNHGISPVQRLQLAKLLSTAILNFHATPWMQSSWKSDDIFLYGMNRNVPDVHPQELEAYIEVPVDEQANHNEQHTPDHLAPFVRNLTLFSLGVMLIELAFERPLDDMINKYDRRHGYATPEYHATMRLSKEVSARLGARYGKIVEQCLLCAFGHGTELDNSSLQSAVHKDVIMELDRLATGFQQLMLAPV